MEAIQRLRAQREQILRELSQVTESECRYPASWAGLQRNVNFLLRVFSLHELDHTQHLHKLLAGRGRSFSEAQILLAKAQALRGELEALLLSLSEEELEATGPRSEDWSIRQLIEHLTQTDAHYAQLVREALERGRAEAAGASPTPTP